MSVRSSLLAVFLSVAASAIVGACGGQVREAPPRRFEPPPQQQPPSSEAALSLQDVGVRVVYEAEWFGAVTLIGIDCSAKKVLLKLESSAPPQLLIDTVELASGERIDRWAAAPERVKRAQRGDKFVPLSGTFEQDLVRFATMLRATGPLALRGAAHSPTVTACEDGSRILYGAPPDDGTDGDWLYAVDHNGHNPRRIDRGLRASYAPVVSPDGVHVAFRGCASSPCDYGLYIAPLPAVTGQPGRPKRVERIHAARPPTWTHDGKAVLTVGTTGSESCLYSVPAAPPMAAKSLRCVGSRDASFTQDPIGRTGVLCAGYGAERDPLMECTWIELATGEVLARHVVERGIGIGVVSASGLFAAPLQKGGLALVDFVEGTSARLPERAGWFHGFDSTQWMDEELVLLRKLEGARSQQVVMIDARQLLAMEAP